MSPYLSEADIEDVAIDILKTQNAFDYVNGHELEPGKSNGRASFSEGILVDRLLASVLRLNPTIESATADAVVRKVTNHETVDLVQNNRRFHKFLVEGVPYEYRDVAGNNRHGHARLVDFDNPENNEWLVVNQFTVKEHKRPRIPDVVLFVNGLPLGLIEFKDPTDENATIETAFGQLQTYKDEIPNFCAYNEFLVISDGAEARLGTITADYSRFQPWKALDEDAPVEPEFTTLAKGVFDKSRMLEMIRSFILFESDGKDVSKKIAAYHQYRATNRAIASTIDATSQEGQRRIGVVWHTQGSGKSLTMVFYAGKAVQHPDLENPTLVVLTDRRDLDSQLFAQFARCEELLRTIPQQAKDREHLKELLAVQAGGIVFTTIQKFLPDEKGAKFPLLTDRRNVIVIADEAHRSQYDMIDGFAKHMRDAVPNASFIGFTGTPIEADDKSTRQVFGEYIDTYDIAQAVADKATVPIYYEPRIARLELKPEEVPHIDPDFEEIVEGEEEDRVRKVKSKWASLEALVGAEHRIEQIVKDLVTHFEERVKFLEGKAMIVCMSRRICVEMYDAIEKIRPDWVSDDDAQGAIKVVMTGSAKDTAWQKHIRSKKALKDVERRFKDPEDPLKIVIVCDMWLTGFDVPSLHTLYMDKPMRRHSLMQAIARVNRVFKDKPAGLVVDYIGLADELKRALATYSASGGLGKPLLDEGEAVAALQTKYEIVSEMFHGFDFKSLLHVTPAEKLAGLVNAADFVLGLEDGRERYLQNSSDLLKAFALASTSDYAYSIRDEVEFFQAVRSKIAKTRGRSPKSDAEMDSAVRQLVAQAVAVDGVVDIMSEAGIKKPDISILSDEFLAEVRGLPQKNLAKEMLERLLRDEIRRRSTRNAVQSKKFSEMLADALRKYKSNAIQTVDLINLLIEMAKEIAEDDKRAAEMGLNDDEIAFYDALAQNQSAVETLGDQKLRIIARALVDSVKKNVSIDWTLRETAKAKIRVLIKRILTEYGYPPDLQKAATDGVLEQAELLCSIEAA